MTSPSSFSWLSERTSGQANQCLQHSRHARQVVTRCQGPIMHLPQLPRPVKWRGWDSEVPQACQASLGSINSNPTENIFFQTFDGSLSGASDRFPVSEKRRGNIRIYSIFFLLQSARFDEVWFLRQYFSQHSQKSKINNIFLLCIFQFQLINGTMFKQEILLVCMISWTAL